MAVLKLFRRGKRRDSVAVGAEPIKVGRDDSCDLQLRSASASRDALSVPFSFANPSSCASKQVRVPSSDRNSS